MQKCEGTDIVWPANGMINLEAAMATGISEFWLGKPQQVSARGSTD